jgi:hypothetical protein
MSNSFLNKNFLSVNRKEKRKRKNHGLIKDNKINTNNKLKVIKKIIRQTWEHITRQHKIMACPYKQKRMASNHIHVRTKFSNKSIDHTVETSFIHTNTETHHICLTYILLKV